MHQYANLQSKMLFNNTQVGGIRKVIGRFGRDMINVGDHIKLHACLILWILTITFDGY